MASDGRTQFSADNTVDEESLNVWPNTSSEWWWFCRQHDALNRDRPNETEPNEHVPMISTLQM